MRSFTNGFDLCLLNISFQFDSLPRSCTYKTVSGIKSKSS